MVIEPLINEELSPGCGPISVQPFLADHLQLRSEEERGVRIDQQQSVMRDSVGRGNGDSVRPGRLFRLAVSLRLVFPNGAFVIESLQFSEVDSLNVPSDAAFREAKRHPWLESIDHSRLGLGMFKNVVI